MLSHIAYPSVCCLWRACTLLGGFNFSGIFLHHIRQLAHQKWQRSSKGDHLLRANLPNRRVAVHLFKVSQTSVTGLYHQVTFGYLISWWVSCLPTLLSVAMSTTDRQVSWSVAFFHADEISVSRQPTRNSAALYWPEYKPEVGFMYKFCVFLQRVLPIVTHFLKRTSHFEVQCKLLPNSLHNPAVGPEQFRRTLKTHLFACC